MNIRTHAVAAIAASAAMFSLSASAHAATALIQGVVFFGTGTPVTEYSKPGSQVAFSFDVPDPLDANPTTEVTNFSYELNGVEVGNPVVDIEFYPVSQNGMFDIVFADHIISIYGADIGSSGNIGPAGFYDITAGVDDQFPGTGSGGGTVDTSAVPEPATWAIMLAGFGGLGLAMRSRRRAALAA